MRPRDGGEGTEFARLLRWARPYAPLLVVALLLGLAVSAADVTRAWLVKPVVDDVVLPHGALLAPARLEGLPDTGPPLDPAARAAVEARVGDSLLRVVLLFAALAVLLPLLEMLRELASSWSLGRVRVDMQRDACAALLSLPLRHHRTERRGDLVARAVHDVDTAQSGVEAFFATFLPALVHVAVGGAFLVAISWRLSLLAVLGGPLLFWILSRFGRRVRRSARRRQEQAAASSQRLLEILDGIQVIKAFRAESAEEEAFRRESGRLFRRSMRVVRERLASRALVAFVNQGLTVGGLALGAWMLIRGAWGLTPGALVAFFLVANQSYQPLKRLAHAFTEISAARAGAARLLALLDAPGESPDPPGALRPAPVPHRVAVRGLSFGYGREPVLRDLSFTLEPGELVALVGRSGAGKSTLVDLLLRLHEPDAGCIEIDGVDLRRLERDAWLARTAVVTQEPFLFDTSVRENIRYGRPEASEEAVLAAGRAARVDAVVRSLPEGYDTEVGASGLRLSGGERQRIAIARALLREPGLLVLDEATSALDAPSEKDLQQAVEALLGGRHTTLVIAHRLATIRRADRILVLEGGRIAEQGAHAELVRRGGLYAQLAALQSESPRGESEGP